MRAIQIPQIPAKRKEEAKGEDTKLKVLALQKCKNFFNPDKFEFL